MNGSGRCMIMEGCPRSVEIDSCRTRAGPES